MLTEDAVIYLLCEHLTADGWKIVSKALADQRGTDVVATRAGIRLEVEAKGGQLEGSHGAVWPAVQSGASEGPCPGEAVFKALAVVAEGKARAAIAFPDSRRHRSLVEPVRPALERLEITVFWVREDGTVRVEPAN